MNSKIEISNDSVFPQANDIYRVIAFVSIYVDKNELFDLNFLKEKITSRQVQYYKSAAEYLGFIHDNKATKLAKHVFSLDKKQILIQIMKIILGKSCFYYYFMKQDEQWVISYLIETYSFSESTAIRRVSTIKSWIKWCRIIIEENKIVLEQSENLG